MDKLTHEEQAALDAAIACFKQHSAEILNACKLGHPLARVLVLTYRCFSREPNIVTASEFVNDVLAWQEAQA